MLNISIYNREWLCRNYIMEDKTKELFYENFYLAFTLINFLMVNT